MIEVIPKKSKDRKKAKLAESFINYLFEKEMKHYLLYGSCEDKELNPIMERIFRSGPWVYDSGE